METKESDVCLEIHATAWHQAFTIETGSLVCVADSSSATTNATTGASATANATTNSSAICLVCVSARASKSG